MLPIPHGPNQPKAGTGTNCSLNGWLRPAIRPGQPPGRVAGAGEYFVWSTVSPGSPVQFIGSSRRPFGAHVEGHAVPGRGEATSTQGWPQSPRPFLQTVGQSDKVSCRPFVGRHEHTSGGSPEPATAQGAWPGHCQHTRQRNLDATIGSAVVFSPGPNSKI